MAEATVADLQTEIRSLQTEFSGLAARLDPAEAGLPGACGRWSFRDVTGHLTWHGREMARLLQSRALAGSELWDLPTDERNERINALNKNESLADLLTDNARVNQQILEALAHFSLEELRDPTAFAGMPPDWVPLEIIRSNTCDHYREHLELLRSWVDRGTG